MPMPGTLKFDLLTTFLLEQYEFSFARPEFFLSLRSTLITPLMGIAFSPKRNDLNKDDSFIQMLKSILYPYTTG